MIDSFYELSTVYSLVVYYLRPDEVNHVVVTIRGDNDCNGHNQAGTSARSESDDSANFNSNKRSMDKKNVQWNFSPIDA